MVSRIEICAGFRYSNSDFVVLGVPTVKGRACVIQTRKIESLCKQLTSYLEALTGAATTSSA
jgi:hypothetical protein